MSEKHFFIFGRKPVMEAFNSGRRLDKVLILKDATGDEIKQIRLQAHKAEIPVQNVPREKLDGLLRKYAAKQQKEPNHQGVVGFLSLIEYYTLDDVMNNALSQGRNPLLVILDGVTDVGNFGAIARSAEAMGADAIVVPSQGSAQINSEAMKASAGSLNRIHVCREKSLVTAIKFLKASGVKVYGADMKGTDVAKADWNVPVALVMGSEGFGISGEVQKLCDDTVRIPMQGVTESLNVSVSAGIILYEAMKARR
ncbi:MAG: 23S rRNA (guanosine(2251)-2'-O)-methyltransferase RlmB [Chitinophagales bacterium]